MQLYLSPTSPYGRLVLAGALNAGIDDLALNFVDPWTNPRELQTHNPFSQIPTLITTSGHVLYDSFVIADYLLDHPIRGAGQAATIAFARILLEQSVKYFSLQRHQPAGTPHPHIRRAHDAIHRALPHAPELKADSNEFAQLALGIAFDYVQLRLPQAIPQLSVHNQSAYQQFTQRELIRLIHPDTLGKRPANIAALRALA